MSRIGRMPITLVKGVVFNVNVDNLVTVKGPKGELQQLVDKDISFDIKENIITVIRPTEQKRHKALHGLYRALIFNMITGVSEGYKKEMELVGVGFRVTNTGNVLEIVVGFSHPIYFVLPKEIIVSTKMEKGSNPTIFLESFDKQLLGQVCAKIRGLRAPEPYKGKGIRFAGEILRRKAGKTASKK